MADDNTFELGLVMAGAISAGAYTAGVMDFLIEALDAFEAAKKQPGWDGPTHTVQIPLMAGASAGGMTSAMAALQSFHEMEHVQAAAPPPAPEKNRLYANWVGRIDLKGLLETRDLDGKEASDGVRSALCCAILDDIVQETFALSGPAKARAWLGRAGDNSLRVLMTLTNLRGVPYSFEIAGSTTVPYAMLNHGDYLDYKIGLSPSATPGTMALDIGRYDYAGLGHVSHDSAGHRRVPSRACAAHAAEASRRLQCLASRWAGHLAWIRDDRAGQGRRIAHQVRLRQRGRWHHRQ